MAILVDHERVPRQGAPHLGVGQQVPVVGLGHIHKVQLGHRAQADVLQQLGVLQGPADLRQPSLCIYELPLQLLRCGLCIGANLWTPEVYGNGCCQDGWRMQASCCNMLLAEVPRRQAGTVPLSCCSKAATQAAGLCSGDRTERSGSAEPWARQVKPSLLESLGVR